MKKQDGRASGDARCDVELKVSLCCPRLEFHQRGGEAEKGKREKLKQS